MKQYKLTVRDTSEQDFWIEAESEDDAKQRFWEEMDHYALSDDEVVDNDIVRVTELAPGDPDYAHPTSGARVTSDDLDKVRHPGEPPTPAEQATTERVLGGQYGPGEAAK
jgi:hypothetical protein